MATFLGNIEAITGKTGVDETEWIELIASDPQLERAPSKTGINPFTKKPTTFEIPRTSAVIVIDDDTKGSIYWAMDGTPTLIVEANEQGLSIVPTVAEQIANRLGCRFVRTG